MNCALGGGVKREILLGNQGRGPEVRYAANGTAIATLALATSERWQDKTNGQDVEKTECHRVVAFGKQAEILGEHATKGSMLYIEGQLATRKWQGKDGTDRYTTEIKVREFQFVGSRQQGQSDEPAARREPAKRHAAPPGQHQHSRGLADFGDNIPFGERRQAMAQPSFEWLHAKLAEMPKVHPASRLQVNVHTDRQCKCFESRWAPATSRNRAANAAISPSGQIEHLRLEQPWRFAEFEAAAVALKPSPEGIQHAV